MPYCVQCSLSYWGELLPGHAGCRRFALCVEVGVSSVPDWPAFMSAAGSIAASVFTCLFRETASVMWCYDDGGVMWCYDDGGVVWSYDGGVVWSYDGGVVVVLN